MADDHGISEEELLALDAREKLLDHWQYSGFRGAQEEIIVKLLQGQNCFGLMPTGMGKSLCYQIPSLLLPGLTVVISPLIALMKDQVDVLKKKGIPAANLDSTQTFQESSLVKSQIRDGTLKLLYVAPERLSNELFLQLMSNVRISMVAVDEAHSVSSWGPAFRPEYLKVGRWIKEVGAERVLCLTATATEQVATETAEAFGIPPENVFRTSSIRDNLNIQVYSTPKPADKLAKMLPILKARTGPMLVYVIRQDDCGKVAAELRANGVTPVSIYHAGMTAEDRTNAQDVFLRSDDMVMCATIAFGMGVDKANVRGVIHYALPKSVESHSQEIGRAGRDGKDSVCVMLLSPEDVRVHEGFARGGLPSRRAIRAFCDSVFGTPVDSDEDCLLFSEWHLSELTDISANNLKILFAILELDFDLIRQTGSLYTTFTVKMDGAPMDRIRAEETSREAKIILSHMNTGKSLYTFELQDAAQSSGIPRSKLSMVFGGWERKYNLDVKASQARGKYKILAEDGILPYGEDVAVFAEAMYAKLLEREKADIARLHEVVALVTGKKCITNSLASYFGEKAKKACGHCSFCETKQVPKMPAASKAKVDPKKIKSVLDGCPYRDDARLLARVAWGLISPRTTALKKKGLKMEGSWGCLEGIDFEGVVEAFEVECKKADYENKPLPEKAPYKPAAKTSYATSGSSYKKSYSGGSSYGSTSNYKKRPYGNSYNSYANKRGKW